MARDETSGVFFHDSSEGGETGRLDGLHNLPKARVSAESIRHDFERAGLIARAGIDNGISYPDCAPRLPPEVAAAGGRVSCRPNEATS